MSKSVEAIRPFRRGATSWRSGSKVSTSATGRHFTDTLRGNTVVPSMTNPHRSRGPSGTFLASAFLTGVCAGQVPFWWLLGVLPKWVSGGCVLVEVEDLV